MEEVEEDLPFFEEPSEEELKMYENTEQFIKEKTSEYVDVIHKIQQGVFYYVITQRLL